MAMAQTTFPKLIGIFQNEYGNYYEYYKTDLEWDILHGFEYRMYVGSPAVRLETRPIKLLKTVVYVGVDEDEAGNPVIEKWKIRSHRLYAR